MDSITKKISDLLEDPEFNSTVSFSVTLTPSEDSEDNYDVVMSLNSGKLEGLPQDVKANLALSMQALMYAYSEKQEELADMFFQSLQDSEKVVN